MALPDYLQQYARTPEEVLGKRVLPPKRHPTMKNTNKLIGRGYRKNDEYDSPEQMQYAVDMYFDRCEEKGEFATIPGLAMALGFSNRHKLVGYMEKGEAYERIIGRAMLYIEDKGNKALMVGGAATHGTVFLLKNHHQYADKVEQKVTHDIGGSLAELVRALDGKVLRPSLPIRENETIEDGEFEVQEEEDAFEEITVERYSQHKTFPSPKEYAEYGEIEDDASDLC